MFGGGRSPRLLCRANLGESRLVVRSAFQSLVQGLLNRDRLGRLIGNLLCEGEILSERQANGSGEGYLLLRKIIPGGNKLLAPTLEFHLSPQYIDARRDAHVSHIQGLIVERLRALDLSIR